jgi:5-methylcytosine-specific restriction enzyme subunit McrC
MIALSEWQTLSPVPGSPSRGVTLRDPSHRKLATELHRGRRLIVRELRDGLEIQTLSWVGRVDLGDVSISVVPKLAPETLLALFHYAYDLDSLALYDAGLFSAGTMSLADLIIVQLDTEARALLGRGLTRRYQPRHESLASPRGRINLDELARAPLTRAELSCTHHVRDLDWPLNRVVLGGLRRALATVESDNLRARVGSTVRAWSADISNVPLDARHLRAASAGLDRQTDRYSRALRLIEMLMDATELGLGAEDVRPPLPGFLFDMNRFFQTLLTRFLREHLDGVEVLAEVPLRDTFAYARDANPQETEPPVPRPDIELRSTGSTGTFLDAKYRDLWATTLPREMLYQLCVYALASSRGEAAIVYPTEDSTASEARIELREHGGRVRTIALRPLVLPALRAALARPERATAGALARRIAYGSSRVAGTNGRSLSVEPLRTS